MVPKMDLQISKSSKKREEEKKEIRIKAKQDNKTHFHKIQVIQKAQLKALQFKIHPTKFKSHKIIRKEIFKLI